VILIQHHDVQPFLAFHMPPTIQRSDIKRIHHGVTIDRGFVSHNGLNRYLPIVESTMGLTLETTGKHPPRGNIRIWIRPRSFAPAGAPARDWHAGWIETSVMLHLHPELVALDKAVRREMRFPEGLPPDGPAPWAWMTTDLNPSGVIGDPRLASAELGRQLVERAAAGLAGLIARMAAAPWPLPTGA